MLLTTIKSQKEVIEKKGFRMKINVTSQTLMYCLM